MCAPGDIVEAHRTMEENKAGGKIVVLTDRLTGSASQFSPCCLTGGSRGLQPTECSQERMGFSPGEFRYAAAMPLAPQELRTYFLTFVTAGRRRLFQVSNNAELFLDVLRDNRSKGRLSVHAFVVMPDHVHLVLTPARDVSLEKAVQFIKGGFSFRLKSKLDVWERGYNETRVVDAAAYEGFCDYIEQNPVRAGLSADARSYEFSSSGRTQDVEDRPEWFGHHSGPG